MLDRRIIIEYRSQSLSMQPGMRVVLATAFWLAVLVAGTVGHHPAGRLIFDQYSSPFDPHQYGVYRRAGGQPDWKDQDPVEKNHPFDPSINPPRSITNTGHDFTEALLHHGAKYLSTDPASRDFSPSSAEDKQPRDPPVDDELVSKKGRAKSREDLSRFEESFVADDTFQDQGPGSLEIYKLDLLRERPLLHGHQVTMFPSGKSKVPKKTSHAAWKPAKTAEYGGRPPPGLPMLLRKQSNSFDEPSTEIPPSADLFGVGGVPELQVGCEGLEAAHYKERRSIDGVRGPRDKARDPWLDVTPITLDLDYEGGGEEEEEEMDELLKLKRLETTTNGVKRNRGDMDAKLHSEFHSDKGAEKLPVRGDLGSSRNNGSSASSARPSRRLLWAAEGGAAHGGEGEGRRRGERGKRALWGFGENEGVAGSDELQTENQRRRMYQERRREQEEEEGRRRAESEIERIRGEYERRLDERQREEEERQRRLQQSNRWQLEAEQRRRLEEEEERRREVLEERSREEEERRQREEEARRRKEQEEEMDRRRFKERRREWLLKQRRLEEEEKERNVTAEREWLRKLERNRPIEFAPLPSSPHHHRHHQQQQQQEQHRPDPSMMDRRKEERKLLEYVRRNQPVQVSRANDSYERNLAEQRTQYAIYNSRNGRRNHGPSAPTNIDPSSYAEESRRREAARRIEEEEEKRREREERMREAERREEEVRRRLSRLYEEERRRKEAARLEAERMAKVQREEEERRSMAGGRTREYEDRRRFDHRRRQDLIPANLVLNQSRRPVVERARQRQEEVERRRQEEERRAKEAREREERDRIMKEQWRRQEEARLNALPVSARIIVQPQKPKVISRIGEFDIDFPGANPFQGGVRFPNFPAPPTRRPPVQSPPPCVWAVIQCCPSNQRLVKCFESLGCPGVNWDSNPCRDNVSEAARAQVEKFYRETEDEEERY